MPTETPSMPTAKMSASIIQFRPRDGLTQAECNDMMARMRPVMVTLCGAMGERAAITTGATDEIGMYVQAVCETEFGPMMWTLYRAEGRCVLVGLDGERIAEAGTLEDVLTLATQ